MQLGYSGRIDPLRGEGMQLIRLGKILNVNSLSETFGPAMRNINVDCCVFSSLDPLKSASICLLYVLEVINSHQLKVIFGVEVIEYTPFFPC